jgi:hypothetical protein
VSFLSDLFRGNFSNLGKDLVGSPTAIMETLGVAAAPFAAFALPELIGGLVPEVGAATAEAAATPSLAAATEAAGTETALSAFDTAAPITDAFAGIAPGTGFSPASTALGDVGTGLAQASAIPAEETTAALPSGWPSWLGGPGGVGNVYSPEFDLSTWASGTQAAADTATTPSLSYAAEGTSGTLDTLSSIGPGLPVPNAPTTLSAPAATQAPQASQGLFPWLNQTGPIGATLKQVAPVAGLGGLGYSLYSGYTQNQQLKDMANQQAAIAAQARQTASMERATAAPIIAQGTDLMSYLTTGTLPAAFQSQVKQNVDAMKAQIIQGYGSRGMPTDPTHNSALAADLAAADVKGDELKTSIESTLSTAGNQMVDTANKLLAAGLSSDQFAAQLPIEMQKLSNELNATTAKSLASFAAAMNLGPSAGKQTATIQLG